MEIRPSTSLFLNFILILVGLTHSSVTSAESFRGRVEIPTTIEISDVSDSSLTKEAAEELILELKKNFNFTATAVEIEGNSIHFQEPRLKERALAPHFLVCAEYKKNFFGYDICQRYSQASIRDILCADLEMTAPSSESDQTEVWRGSSDNHISIYNYNGEDYSLMRTSSMLVGRLRFNILGRLSCELR